MSQRLSIRFWTYVHDYKPCFMRSMSILEEMLQIFATTVQTELNATLRVCESGLQDVLTNRSDFTSNVVFQFLCPTGKNRTDLIQEILAVIRFSKLSGHQKSFRFRSCSHSRCGMWLHPAENSRFGARHHQVDLHILWRFPDSEQYSKTRGRKCIIQPVRERHRSFDMLLMKQGM